MKKNTVINIVFLLIISLFLLGMNPAGQTLDKQVFTASQSQSDSDDITMDSDQIKGKVYHNVTFLYADGTKVSKVIDDGNVFGGNLPNLTEKKTTTLIGEDQMTGHI